MADSAEAAHVHWVCPPERGQLSIMDMHIPKNLKKAVKRAPYEIRIDSAFEDVIQACGAPSPDRPETWINQSIIDVYCDLHARGHAHSVECWKGGVLVGGLYGLKIGGAFFGESMFSRSTDASKVALVHLVARLYAGGFKILDTQFVNDHLQQFGVYEIAHDEYIEALQPVLQVSCDFQLESLNERQIITDYLSMRAS